MADSNIPPIVTPFWEDKTVKMILLYTLTLVGNVVAKKWGYSLDSEAIAGETLALVAFIAGHKWKTATLMAAAIKAGAEATKTPEAVQTVLNK